MTTEKEDRKLTVERLTPDAFSPFGRVLSPEARERLPINTYGDKLDLYRERFDSDQPIEWFIVRGRIRAFSALFLERHMQLTQTFIPMNGDGFVMVVARPDAREAQGMIAFDGLRAFHIPGDAAVQLHRGSWHENPFPVRDNQWFLVTCHAALTLGHQQNPDERLKALPLDLERRWFKDAAWQLTLDVA